MTRTDLCVNKPHWALSTPTETLFPILLLESVVNFSGRDFSPTRNLITMRCSMLRGTFCSLITLATPRQDWTGSNPSRREGGDCGFTLSRSHSCCAVRLVYTQINPGHIWTTLYIKYWKTLEKKFRILLRFLLCVVRHSFKMNIFLSENW